LNIYKEKGKYINYYNNKVKPSITSNNNSSAENIKYELYKRDESYDPKTMIGEHLYKGREKHVDALSQLEKEV
jgi:hypothetical protein